MASLVALGCDASPAPSCTIAAPVLATGALHTDGTRLRDEWGRVVSLRGVNAGGRSKFAPYAPFDYADGDYDAALAAYLDRAAAWGVDVLRVPLNWAAVEPVRGSDDEAFWVRYDKLLDGAWKRGMRTIVDFHQDVYAEAFCGDGFPAWTIAGPGPVPPPHHDCPGWYNAYGTAPVMSAFDAFWADGSSVQADYAALWQRLAAREKNRPGVVGFELFNEPSAGSADNAAFESGTLTRFYAKIVPMVAASAPGALLLLDAAGISSASLKTSLGDVGAIVGPGSGAGIVFAPHYYQPLTIFDGDGRPDLVEQQLRMIMAPAKAWNVPVFLGEWGAAQDPADSADFVAAHHAAFDTLGLSATQWQYSVARDKWNAEPLDLAGADGTPTAVVAGFLRPHAQAVAGDAIAPSYDPATRAYTLSFAPVPMTATTNGPNMSDISDIIVPKDAYPAGYTMKITGGCADTRTPGHVLLRANGDAPVSFQMLPR